MQATKILFTVFSAWHVQWHYGALTAISSDMLAVKTRKLALEITFEGWKIN